MKIIRRIFFFIFVLSFGLVVREAIQLINWMYHIHLWVGHVGLSIILISFFYYIVVPIIKVIALPVYPEPVEKIEDEENLIRKRLKIIARNRELVEGQNIRETYENTIREINKEVQTIRKKYVSEVFYSTSIAQNGFLDALFIFSAAIRMIREIFILYQGRVSNKDLWHISKKIYMAMVVAGSEGVEYAAQEIFSRVSFDGMKSIPFMDKLVGSLADGFVNAAMLTRISMVTENYCSLTLIQNEQSLVPTVSSVAETTKQLIGDMTKRIREAVRSMVIEKSTDYARLALNPAAYVLEKSGQVASKTKDITLATSNFLKLGMSMAINPLFGGIQKIYSDFFKRESK